MDLNELIEPLAVVVLVLLVVFFPVSGVWDYRRLVRGNAEGMPNARMRFYVETIAEDWVSVGILVTWWFLSGREAATLGLTPIPSGWQWLAVAAGLFLSLLLVVQTHHICRRPQTLSSLRGRVSDLADMIPRNEREQRAFDWLSLSAGICEEILYRGLLFAILVPAIGTWPAVIVSSIIFGLGHIYQGPLGFVKTTVAGLVFMILTVFSGSLFTAMIFHFTMDLTSSRIMAAATALPGDDSVSETD